ncbi:MAG: helix-turn-helix domain-containing protein, partial [Opitutus sp.]
WWSSFQRVLSPALVWQRELLGQPAGHVQLDPVACRSAEQSLHDLLERGAVEPTLLPEVMARIVRFLIASAAVRHTAPTMPTWLRGVMSDLQDPALLAEPIAKWQKRAGVSPEHFARTCRRCLGESPTVLLNRARVESIKLRLRLGDEKVTALALEAGFQNVSFFYRCFRRFADCTPKEWAAQHAAAVTVPR